MSRIHPHKTTTAAFFRCLYVLVFAIFCPLCAKLYATENVFLKRDTIVVLARGYSSLGVGIYAPEANPFAQAVALKNALELAEGRLIEHPEILNLPMLPTVLMNAGLNLFSVNVFRAQDSVINERIYTFVDVIATAPLSSLKSRIKTISNSAKLQKHSLLFSKRYYELLTSLDAGPNTRPRCQSAINSLAAITNGFSGVMCPKPIEQIVFLTKSVSFDTTFAPSLMMRGLSLLELNNPEAALHDLDRALRSDSTLVEAWWHRASIKQKASDIPGAIHSLNHLIALHPNNKEGLLALGTLHKSAGTFDSALTAFSHIITIEPDNTEALLNRASIFDTLGRFTEAITDYTTILKANSSNAQGYYRRGIGFLALGKGYEERAEFDFTRVLSLAPANVDAFFQRGLSLMAQGKYGSATNDFSAGINARICTPQIFYQRGCGFALQKRHQEAIGDFSRAIELKADYAFAYYNRGFSYAILNNLQQAINDFTQTLALKPDFFKAYYNRAMSYRQLNRNNEAIADFLKYVELAGNSAGMESSVRSMIQELRLR